MSDDLVKRLLNEAGKDLSEVELHALCKEAAERIKQVEGELIRTHRLMMADAKRVEQLEAALSDILKVPRSEASLPIVRMIAGIALEGKKND